MHNFKVPMYEPPVSDSFKSYNPELRIYIKDEDYQISHTINKESLLLADNPNDLVYYAVRNMMEQLKVSRPSRYPDSYKCEVNNDTKRTVADTKNAGSKLPYEPII